MRTRSFWTDTAERAIKTLAQALIAVLAVGTPIYEIAWVEALGIAATAAVISVLTSIASAGVGESGTAAVVSGLRGQEG
ncbi:holin [Corynebacterium sp. zg-331]|uniref:holin n=1 Tax=unclassified Corynebacterium TaxID=2624378 RepID=UPI00128E0244|nr:MULTISPECIES: holin [unclassified Corynebacterium]MBC3186353.1 holin [Corynebacterium sp. zg-331]MPV52841.1 holin [Corynebacterium sp. zg331]